MRSHLNHHHDLLQPALPLKNCPHTGVHRTDRLQAPAPPFFRSQVGGRHLHPGYPSQPNLLRWKVLPQSLFPTAALQFHLSLWLQHPKAQYHQSGMRSVPKMHLLHGIHPDVRASVQQFFPRESGRNRVLQYTLQVLYASSRQLLCLCLSAYQYYPWHQNAVLQVSLLPVHG